MKKAINIYFYNADTKTKLDAIKNSGYVGVLLSMHTVPETMTIQEQLSYCKEIGLDVSMIHCQYNPATLDYFWEEESEIAEQVTNEYISQIESISDFDVKNFVIHLSGFEPAKTSKFGLERIKKILEICKKNNIKLCVENLEYPKQTDYILKNITHENLFFCYDSGHKNCFSPNSKIAIKYSSILSATHIHDNFGKHDDHKILGVGTTNLNTLAKELFMSNCEYLSAEIKYRNSDISMNEILEKNLNALNELDEIISKLKSLKN